MKSRSGIVDPVTLSLVALMALGIGVFGGTWKPFAFLKPKPPTAELTKLQGDLAKAQSDADQARKDKESAIASERAKLEQELRSAQGDNLGTTLALGRVPAEHKTAEVKLAQAMANRVSLKLAAALGKIPQDQQDAIISLIDEALSDKQSEVDKANAKLAAMDTDFKALQAQRDQIRSQIPVLEQKAAKAMETANMVQSQVTEKTNEVKAKADQLDAEQRKSGSLGTSLEKVWHWIVGAVAVWFFLAVVLPGIIKHMPSESRFKSILRDVAGIATSPLLYLDARMKLNQPKT